MSDHITTCIQAVKFAKQASVLRLILQNGLHRPIFAGYAIFTKHRAVISSFDYTTNIEEATAIDDLDHDQLRTYLENVFEDTDHTSVFANKITVTYDTMRKKDRHIVEDFWPVTETKPVPTFTPYEGPEIPVSLFDIDDKFHRSISNRGLLYVQVYDQWKVDSVTMDSTIRDEGYVSLICEDHTPQIKLVNHAKLVSKATLHNKDRLIRELVIKYGKDCRIFVHPEESGRDMVDVRWATILDQIFPIVKGKDQRVAVCVGRAAPALQDTLDGTSMIDVPVGALNLSHIVDTNSRSVPAVWSGDVVLFCVETSSDGFVRNCGFVMFEPNIHAYKRDILLVQNKKQASVLPYARAVQFIDATLRRADPDAAVVREYICMFV